MFLLSKIIRSQRRLRPACVERQMMVDCCATDATACTLLKAQFPQLNSNNPDINPDYCYMHGNVCDRWGMTRIPLRPMSSAIRHRLPAAAGVSGMSVACISGD